MFSLRSLLSAFIGACAFMLPVVALAAAPTVSSFSPADNSGGAGREANLSIKFDQTVIKSGSTLATPSRIRIFKHGAAGTGVLVENINASGAQVTVSSATVTINPSVVLDKNTEYFIHIETNAFVNASDESYAGISNDSTWNFRTIGGGAAANRQIREALLADVPQHYNKEAPCLEDVGIFVPGGCGSDNVSSNTAPAAVTTVQPAAPKETPRKTLSQELIDQKAKRAEKLMRALDNQVTKSAAPEAQTYENSMQERTCERVRKNFAGDRKMIDRINERLMKRFAWKCDL